MTAPQPRLERRELILQASHVDGYYGALDGKLLIANPWPSGSPGAIAWAEGWHEGYSDIVAQRRSSASSVWFKTATFVT